MNEMKKIKTIREKFRTVRVKLRVKPEKLTKIPIRKRKLRRKKVYIKEKCHFHDENQVRCINYAIGSGQLCKKHGGELDLGNTMDPISTQKYMDLRGKGLKFNPAVHPLQMIDLSRQGMSDVEIAAEMHIGVHSLRKWAEDFEEFATAYEIGQALHESWWLQQGKAGLESRTFNTSLFKFLTGNKIGYADKIETKNFNMNACGVLVAPAKQSIEEWEVSGQKGEKG